MNETTQAVSAELAAPSAPFDPYSIRSVTTGELRVRDHTQGVFTGWVITLAGPEHPERKRRFHAAQRRMRQAFIKAGGKAPDIDPEEQEATETDMLVACTLGWQNGLYPYSPQKARELYTDPDLAWLRFDVREALDERERFIKASAKN